MVASANAIVYNIDVGPMNFNIVEFSLIDIEIILLGMVSSNIRFDIVRVILLGKLIDKLNTPLL